MITICKYCKKEFRTYPSRHSKYCSNKCYFQEKYGLENRKIVINCLNCGKSFLTYLVSIKNKRCKYKFCSLFCYHKYPKSEEFRKKISRAMRGYNHPRWKGGIMKGRKDRNLLEYKKWRYEVFKRDNFTCQYCGIRNSVGLGKSVVLNAHHLKSWTTFPELRYDINNGLTLCEPCHDKTRSKDINGGCKCQ